ncbi:chloride channel CLIC-like protein 1 isoform X1 [Triplophysa rosa]|uniref:chloride channel CLIC-like protein 1 isoform X1 n=1 Tax=Triplophysa rosa TaxID=992332 RepID=UPI002545DEA4|nr:chloride channel CLIC-like protein 1 isoform X1 [Triplophysa rosa]
MKVLSCLLFGFCSSLVFCGPFAYGNSNHDDKWTDPNDMINYDPTTKQMRIPTEKACTTVQQPTCLPVFKRFISKLLRETAKLGLPDDAKTAIHYDVEIKLSKQTVSEFQKLFSHDSDWSTGAMDEALSQILLSFKLHDPEAWKWGFEDIFHVELNTVIKVLLCVLIVSVIICTEMWTAVSWLMQFKRMFWICFLSNFIWNWFFLYMLEFAEHQKSIVQMESFNAKCTGVKEMNWVDSFSEWFRQTWTLQDDPCKKVYELLLVNPFFRVSPIRVFTVTVISLFTDPLEHIGQGCSKFYRALLRDMPVTLQIPMLVMSAGAIFVTLYSAFRHVLPLVLRGHQDPPPPAVGQPLAAQLQ